MRHPLIPRELTRQPFVGADAVRRGLITRRQLRSSCWVRLFHDVFVLRELATDVFTLIAAAALVLPSDAVFSGLTALWLHGVRLSPIDEVEASVPATSGLRTRPRLRIRCTEVPPEHRGTLHGFVVTTPLRTAADIGRRLPLVEAVVQVEELLRVCALKLPDIAAIAARGQGAAQLRRVLELVNPRAESPMETRLRLLLVQAGLACPVVQHVVLDAMNRFVARVDLAYPELLIAIEYDGDHHREARTMVRDAQRQNELVQLGWTVLRFTATDVYRHPERVIATVRRALEMAGAARY